jgi:outer membrane protein assembly factor BamD (BamD/ComL family)
MSPSKKISKHQIKEDKLVTTTFKATEYIQKNPKPFVITGIAILAIFTLIVVIKFSMDKRQQSAQELYIRANLAMAAGNVDAAVADYMTLVNEYDSTPYARTARLALANKYYGDQNWEQSLSEFENLADDSGDDKMMLSIALAGMASCYEQMGNYQQAGKKYREAADVSDSPLLAPGQLLKAGQNFAKAGDKTQASDALKIIEEKYNTSPEASAARRLYAEVNI